MTDDDMSGQDTPLSEETLADLHAGVFDEETAARLWDRVSHDEWAQEVLTALTATTADLNTLAAAPQPTIPEQVAGRLDAALTGQATETAAPADAEQAPVIGIDTTRRNRRRLLGWSGGLAAAAAAAVVATTVITGGETTSGQPQAANPTPGETGTASSTPALHDGALGRAIGTVVGERDLGPLHNHTQLRNCLTANDIDPDQKPAGISPGTVDGESAVIVLYPTGEHAQFRLIALSPDCGDDNTGDVLADTTVGRGTEQGGG